MAFERTKILTTFAIFGFLIGTAAYFIFNWARTASLLELNPAPIANLILSPWFTSGIVGAILAMLIVFIVARLKREG